MAEAAVKGTPAPAPSGAKSLVRVENVVKHFPAGLGAHVHAVDGVSFDIREGETLGLVGESGCGKSTLARLVTQLIPATSGKVFFGDVELTKLRGEKLRQYRRQLQMIFQDPFASLDPRMTVGDIIAEPLDNFRVTRGRKRNERVQELLKIVGLNPNFNNRYPHEFSGGQRQRIGIARALALNPKLVVCDEAVTAPPACGRPVPLALPGRPPARSLCGSGSAAGGQEPLPPSGVRLLGRRLTPVSLSPLGEG